MILLLDTNFMMVPYLYGVDVIRELARLRPEAEAATVPAVMDELAAIAAAGRGRENIAAEVGLKLARAHVRVVGPASGRADDELLACAAREGAAVCTQDRELKRRLKAAGLSVVTMRKKSHLVEVDP